MINVLAILFLCAFVLAGAVWLMVWIRRQQRIARARIAPFPASSLSVLKTNMPVYHKLPNALQEQLKQLVNVFLVDKWFEGCGGQEIDDEIRVTIAAQACMLLLNRDDPVYPRLRTILVYPSAYVAGEEGKSVRIGESWDSGQVVLAWDSVKHGAWNIRDGHNVTLHEFAHQLDQENGFADGAPILEARSAYSSWANAFAKAFERHCRRVEAGRKTVLDAYGAQNPAEFFAVATETFFEKPKQLSKRYPDLYEVLKGFYKVDPLTWERIPG